MNKREQYGQEIHDRVVETMLRFHGLPRTPDTDAKAVSALSDIIDEMVADGKITEDKGVELFQITVQTFSQ